MSNNLWMIGEYYRTSKCLLAAVACRSIFKKRRRRKLGSFILAESNEVIKLIKKVPASTFSWPNYFE